MPNGLPTYKPPSSPGAYTLKGRAAMLTSRPLNNTQYIYHPTSRFLWVGQPWYVDPTWYPGKPSSQSASRRRVPMLPAARVSPGPAERQPPLDRGLFFDRALFCREAGRYETWQCSAPGWKWVWERPSHSHVGLGVWRVTSRPGATFLRSRWARRGKKCGIALSRAPRKGQRKALTLLPGTLPWRPKLRWFLITNFGLYS
jgi:hypothetical protein